MLFVVYLQAEGDQYPILVATFLMKSDAESFVKNSNLKDKYFIKETGNEAWLHWRKIREEI